MRKHVLATAALVTARLFLGAFQSVTALANAGNDDRLFLTLADKLASGKWLGNYDHLTLAKGPFYSMWLATCFLLHVPLLVAEHAVYVAACALFVLALTPVLSARTWRVVLFGALLFNPASFADGPMSRVIREGIYPALTLFVLGAAVGLALRLEQSFRATAQWSLALGVSLAAFKLCREESVWLAPTLLLVLVGIVGPQRRKYRAAAFSMGVAFCVFGVAVGAVTLANRIRYGAAVVTEFTAGPFPEAYSALVHVEDGTPRAFVPVTTATLHRIYGVSPHFADLEPRLEGDVGRAWRSSSCKHVGVCDEIAGGWLMWALRDAAARAGQYKTAGDAANYWAAVSTELKSACSDKRLSCAPSGSGFLPPLRHEDEIAVLRSTWRAARYLVGFDEVAPGRSPSVGSRRELDDFARLTRSRLAKARRAKAGVVLWEAALETKQSVFVAHLTKIFGAVVPPLSVAALLGFLLRGGVSVARRRADALFVVEAGLLAAVLARLVIVALIDTTSFPAINVIYLSPAYPLLLAWVILSIFEAVNTAGRHRANAVIAAGLHSTSDNS